MANYGPENIRNLSLLSHNGAGKTSLAEAILFTAKVVNRLGRVDDGSSTSDYDPAEQKRNISISLSMLPYEWLGKKVNLIDTPGYPDFVGEVKSGLRVSEGAVVVICAASGVEVGTEQVWSYLEENNLPRLIFINKMDRENADFARAVEGIQSRFGRRCVPLQVPIGAHNDFQGVVDLIAMKGYTGTAGTEGDIPDSVKGLVETFREQMVEAAAEVDDSLIEKYLGGEELSREELTDGLRQGVIAGKVVPILAGSATKNIGTSLLMDAICNYIPSPVERDVRVIGADGGEETVPPGQDSPLAALVFKTSADPYVGKLTYFRVYNGSISSNSHVWNTTKGEDERIGQLFVLRGKTQEPVPEITSGDIGAVAKLNVTGTGDTLGKQDNLVKIVPVSFPSPIFSEAVYPRTKVDLDKLGPSLTKLTEEDPTLQVRRDSTTNETIISGLGDTQLEVAAEKMERKFGVSVDLETPKVPYKETIASTVSAEYKHKKQTGGHGQYGHVLLELEPLPRGGGRAFGSKVVGGSIPRNYIPAVEKGFNEGVQEGVLAGYPVDDIKVTVYDGSFHPVDSSEICFKIAGAGAMRRGLADAQPVLLEPIMDISIRAPEEYTGDIIGDLNTKRAQVQGMNPEDGINVVDAQVPQAEVLRYSIALKSITQGKGTFTMKFSHYQEVPPAVTQKVIAARQAEKEKDRV
ncbi:MAG: elongation factor G [Dehalococcoidales bacterium]|nr:elongation factor G [Dehalococcoidales bacterium]